LKEEFAGVLRGWRREVVDFGADKLDAVDDYPDFIVALAIAVAAGDVRRGIALCGSGVGASIAANKIAEVRAAVIHDTFSVRQGVEDDDVNVLCLGGKVIGSAVALEITCAFLTAAFDEAPRHRRRLEKVRLLDGSQVESGTLLAKSESLVRSCAVARRQKV
jgi:ribose 5-phosphate isomerase B